jgi:hypothetical protein
LVKDITGVCFHFEGGRKGEKSKDHQIDERRALSTFLTPIKEKVHAKGWEWRRVKTCGSRKGAYDSFVSDMKYEPETLHILLVDAEETQTGETSEKKNKVWDYLLKRDGWVKPDGANEENCFLMVRMMETWLIADIQNMEKFYGKDFNSKLLPSHNNIESVSKSSLKTALTKATKDTSKKDYYDRKAGHGFALLETTNPEIVREKCPSCERLFSVLTEKIR